MAAASAGTGKARPALIRYVYIDIVDFSVGRSVEAQSEIIETLSSLVGKAVTQHVPLSEQVLFLPTGDGMCICLINLIHPFDLDILIALSVLDQLQLLNGRQIDYSRRFSVRIGINENQDNLVLDIKGGLNVVGLGINMAQRVMSVAGPSRLFLGQAVYARLCQREFYRHWLHPVQAIVKHGEKLLCYEYFNPARPCFASKGLRSSSHAAASAASAVVVQLPLAGSQPRKAKPRNALPPSFQVGP